MFSVNRYTDFLVNEILPSGKVLHLHSILPPPSKADNNSTRLKSETTPTSNVKPAPSAPEAAKPELVAENAGTKSDVPVKAKGEDEKIHEVSVAYTICLRRSNYI
jgi:tRNA pseudouridine13 synthase